MTSLLYSKGKGENTSVVESYTDPLIELLHASDLNKDKELSTTLCEYIDEIDDNELKQWCIDSLTILRNLERIETQLDQWEFHTLDYTIEVANNDIGSPESEKNPIHENLAKRVLEKSNKVRTLLLQEKPEISISVSRARNLSKNNPAKVITDAGTILVELTMRIVKLAKHLDEQITIGYSRAKLTMIGTELKKLVTFDPFLIDREVVKNYKIFVNNLLNQLNNAAAHNDTVGLWESVAIVGDVEKMFESMKRKAMLEKKDSSQDAKESKNEKPNVRGKVNVNVRTSEKKKAPVGNSGEKPDSSPSALYASSSSKLSQNGGTGYGSNTPAEEKAVSKISAKEIFNNDNDLIRTKISDHIPELMNAFQSKAVQNGGTRSKPCDGNGDIEKEPPAEKEEADADSNVRETKPGISFFNPSILNAFYQPKLKEPIYVNKASIESNDKRADRKTAVKQITSSDAGAAAVAGATGVNGKSLSGAYMAIKLDQLAQDTKAQTTLLEKEKRLRDREVLIGSMMRNPQPLQTSSPILQSLSASMMGKSTGLNKENAK